MPDKHSSITVGYMHTLFAQVLCGHVVLYSKKVPKWGPGLVEPWGLVYTIQSVFSFKQKFIFMEVSPGHINFFEQQPIKPPCSKASNESRRTFEEFLIYK